MRKYCDENKVFNKQRAMQFLFSESNRKVLFLGCQETIAVLKEHNLKRHDQSRHEAKCSSIRGQEREAKIKQLMKLVHRQQIAITKLGGTDHCFKAILKQFF